jgi:hypothetical protein
MLIAPLLSGASPLSMATQQLVQTFKSESVCRLRHKSFPISAVGAMRLCIEESRVVVFNEACLVAEDKCFAARQMR